MHALSSDTRIIYVLTISLFDNFDQDLQWSLENFITDSDYQRVEDLHEKLSQISYTLEDDELLTFVRTLFPTKYPFTKGLMEDIATHYGWGKVDERRQTVILGHWMDYAYEVAGRPPPPPPLYPAPEPSSV